MTDTVCVCVFEGREKNLSVSSLFSPACADPATQKSGRRSVEFQPIDRGRADWAPSTKADSG